MNIVDLVQGTEEWHAWRRSGTGGSDAPVVLGISPYKTPLQLYREKVNEPTFAEEDESNEFIFAKGHKVESLIRKQFAELTGVEMKPVCIRHEKFDFMIASLDGFDSRLGVLEAKLVGKDALEAAREGIIPHHHMAQVQHQLEVGDVDVGQWFGHDGKKNGVLVEVKRDKNYAQGLIDLESRFWENVVHRIPPALSARDYLIPIDEEILRELEVLREAKEHADNADAHFKIVREKVLKRIADLKHPKIAGAGLQIYQTETSGSVDWLSIPEMVAIKETLDSQYVEKFRKEGRTSWTVKMAKRA